MNRSIIISSVLHLLLILVTAMSLPFLAKKPLDIPPIISVELIQITENSGKTWRKVDNIPDAPYVKLRLDYGRKGNVALRDKNGDGKIQYVSDTTNNELKVDQDIIVLEAINIKGI